MPYGFNRERIAVAQLAVVFLNRCHQGRFTVFQRRLADAVDPLVGGDFDEHPVGAVAVADQRLDFSDFHVVSIRLSVLLSARFDVCPVRQDQRVSADRHWST